MRILISPVGMQDPFSPTSNEEGSVVTLCRKLRPDLVYLLPTAERHDARSSTAQAAEDTRAWLASDLPEIKVFIKPLDVADPTDYHEVLQELHRVVRAIVDETTEIGDRELFLNASSATPQIKTAGLMLVASGVLPARPFQVADPRFQTRADRVQEIDVAFLVEGPTIDKVHRLFDRHLFAVCQEELQGLAETSVLTHRRYAAAMLAKVCDAYAALDRLAYSRVAPPLQSALKDVRGVPAFDAAHATIEAQLATLRELTAAAEAERFTVLCDIYHNAIRRFDEENFADVLARAWRVAEGCLFHRLRETYGIEPRRLPASRNQANLQKLRAARPEAGWLMLKDAREVLESVFGDERLQRRLRKAVPPEFGAYRSFGAFLEDLRDARNQSVAAHGVKPVTKEVAQQGLFLARTMLDFAFPSMPVDDFAFSSEKLQVVAGAAFDALAR